MNEFIVSTGSGRKVISSDNGSRDKSRKGSRKGESGDTDEAHLFIYLYEQDTTDDNTLRNRWNALSNDEQEYILGQFGESRQDFEETFDPSRNGSRKGDRDIVKEIIDKFSDYDEVDNDELIKLAKELPDGKGKDVIIGLGVGAWRGDEPEEEEFFRIIDSKY